MGTATQLLDWARTQLGVTENPPGSNHVRYWDDVNMHGDQGQPWCAAFYLAGLVHIGVNPVTRSVYVPQIEQDYRRAGRFYPVEAAQPGDQLIYRIGDGHTGVVEALHPETRTVVAIEGNTSSGIAGSQDNGGGVFRRSRPYSLVIGVGRPPFAPPAPTDKVAPMHNPPIIVEPVVADLACPTGGAWTLAASGAVYAWGGAPFRPWPTRAVDFAGRSAATLELGPDSTHPYTIVDTQNERYSP